MITRETIHPGWIDSSSLLLRGVDFSQGIPLAPMTDIRIERRQRKVAKVREVKDSHIRLYVSHTHGCIFVSASLCREAGWVPGETGIGILVSPKGFILRRLARGESGGFSLSKMQNSSQARIAAHALLNDLLQMDAGSNIYVDDLSVNGASIRGAWPPATRRKIAARMSATEEDPLTPGLMARHNDDYHQVIPLGQRKFVRFSFLTEALGRKGAISFSDGVVNATGWIPNETPLVVIVSSDGFVIRTPQDGEEPTGTVNGRRQRSLRLKCTALIRLARIQVGESIAIDDLEIIGSVVRGRWPKIIADRWSDQQ